MSRVAQIQEYWEQLQTSPLWEQLRLGEEAWEDKVQMENTLREIYSKLGLPWVDSGPTTLSRAAYLLFEFGTNGLQIARFLRSVLGPQDGRTTEEHSETLQLRPGLGLPLASTTETLAAPSSVPETERVIILDIGSFFTKVGWASEPTPSVTFPSVLENGSSPIDRGVVKDWAGFEFLIRKAFEALKADPSQYPVIVCIAPKTPKGHKNEIAKIMFKTLKVPSILFASTSYCGLCSIDGMAACVVNVGGGIVHTVPYYEGLLIAHAIQRLDVAGQDITDYVVENCKLRGHVVTNQEAENFKTSFYIVPDKDSKSLEEEVGDKIVAIGFRPDGGEVPLGKEVFKGPEMLFRPQILMREVAGLPEMIRKTITQCDLDTRKGMWENVIVCGGSSMFPGFVERLQKELVALSPDNTTPVVKAAENRFNVAHKGASNLAYYEEFYDWSITLDDYEIDGEEVFDAKCIN